MTESNIIPPNAASNRSFLHRHDVKPSEKYDTVVSVAMKKTSLPLQLVSSDIDDAIDQEQPDNIDNQQPSPRNSIKRLPSFKMQPKIRLSSNETRVEPDPIQSKANIANKAAIDTRECTEARIPWINDGTEVEAVETLSSQKSSIISKKFSIPKLMFSSQILPPKSKTKKRLKNNEIRSQLNVSPPSDFVHVSGSSQWSWTADHNSSDTKNVITPIGQDSYTLHKNTTSYCVETLVDKVVEESVEHPTALPVDQPQQLVANDRSVSLQKSDSTSANNSFLWNLKAKYSDYEKNTNTMDEGHHEKIYDDIVCLELNTSDEEIYDDVGITGTCGTMSSDKYQSDDEQIYDDIMPLRYDDSTDLNYKNNVEIRKNSKVSIEEKLDSTGYIEKEDNGLIYMRDDHCIYDDVLTCESRINSIYVSSSPNNIPKLNVSNSSDRSKDDEWEDIDECSSSDASNSQKMIKNADNKKKSGQRFRKVRSKSKTSRRNSTRPSSWVNRQSENLSDTGSDDSKYETLYSVQPTEFNGEDEDTKSHNSMSQHYPNEGIEAPTKPIPPSPRDSGKFGRKIKLLRRTWSFTKCNLGKIRKRSSMPDADDEECQKTSTIDSQQETWTLSSVGKLKKHLQKSINSLSTFYLDNANDIPVSGNNNRSTDDICRHSEWFVNYPPPDNNEDDYNIQTEPLYQHYTANAVRGAFQSDSDSYGDPECSKTLQTPSDLSIQKRTTMWSETPQVMRCGLLGQLTVEEKKLQEAKFEIFTSEASYLNSLRVLVNEYVINHELVYEILSSTDREKLFGNVPSVLIASEKLLRELEKSWIDDPMMRGFSDILLNHAKNCSNVYVEYCSNQVRINSTLKELKSKKSIKFMEAISKIEAHPACQSLTLYSFLMLPMQRVTRLPLLADAVLSRLSTDHEERMAWENVLAVLSNVVKDCNEGARTVGRKLEMEALAQKIEWTKVSPIDLRNRYLVRSGNVTQLTAKSNNDYKLTLKKKFHKAALYLLLLTDHVLVAKIKSTGQDETYSVIDSCKRSLVALEKVPDDTIFVGKHAIMLTFLENHCGKQVEYVLSCLNDTDRERWLEAVSPVKSNEVGETLYESWDCPQVMAIYSYSPSQPDELCLQPGDVINVTKKMPDNWNFGEKLVGGEQGWFPGNFTKEVESEHVRARNLRQRYRLLALSDVILQQRRADLACTNGSISLTS